MSVRVLPVVLASSLTAVPAHARVFGEWERAGDGDRQEALVVVEVPGGAAYGAIVVRCDVAGLSVFVDVGAPLMQRRPVPVEFEFDAREIQRARWHPAPDGVGAFAPDPLPFARELAARWHLTVTAMDETGERHRADFPLIGSAAAIRPVLAGCGGP